jgi:hypothetical protein
LQLDLPESFRRGDPGVAPLLLVLDEHEPYGAVVLDAERLRYYGFSPPGGSEDGEKINNNSFREVDLRPSNRTRGAPRLEGPGSSRRLFGVVLSAAVLYSG